ncbi:nuclear transport factor 2 family protein [Novosphingobium malaysiense]|uniref:SnoaL-like domain-containing protein n=1 Tax=Novosphingobium malaysiense TaxID=1348853 RepID=A0A0B1ZUQ9_9SPHN|nr:nuclear transport factor 2 family protein [Novosphingobium malaysiense]KHK93169.1 hypothetical protein LK12_02190 [Novosphingobium malaysiense]
MPQRAFEDHQANVDLMNRFAHALDSRDWDLLASLYTEDARFHARQYLENAVRPEEDFMVMAGRETILSTLQEIWRGLSATHHMLSNYVVDLAGDGRRATASCYLRAHHVGNGDRAHLFEESLGRFDFQTVFDGEAWKICRQDENIFIVLGTPDAFAPPSRGEPEGAG